MDDFYPSMNGVIEVMNNQAIRLTQKGHEVVMVVPKTAKKYRDNFPYKVIRVPSVKIGMIGYSMAMPKMDLTMEKKLFNEKFDIIHIHSPFIMGKLGAKIANKLKIPAVATLHTQYDKDVKKFVKSGLITKIFVKDLIGTFNKCDKTWATNAEVAQMYKDMGMKVMPGVQITGCDMVLHDNLEKGAEFVNRKHWLKKDKLVFLFVGRLTVLKNVLFLLDALKHLKDNNVDFKMIFVGPFEDKKEIEKKIKELKLKRDIIFAGKITDRKVLRNYYCRAKLFLFPSMYDTNSLVQKEAASQKVPTVFIDGSATAHLVTNNVNGFLCKNDPKLYAMEVIKILGDDKLYKKVSEGAYREIYVSWDDLMDDLINDYTDIIKQYKKSQK